MSCRTYRGPRRKRFLPLPQGEGWGEGIRMVRLSAPASLHPKRRQVGPPWPWLSLALRYSPLALLREKGLPDLLSDSVRRDVWESNL